MISVGITEEGTVAITVSEVDELGVTPVMTYRADPETALMIAKQLELCARRLSVEGLKND